MRDVLQWIWPNYQICRSLSLRERLERLGWALLWQRRLFPFLYGYLWVLDITGFLALVHTTGTAYAVLYPFVLMFVLGVLGILWLIRYMNWVKEWEEGIAQEAWQEKQALPLLLSLYLLYKDSESRATLRQKLASGLVALLHPLEPMDRAFVEEELEGLLLSLIPLSDWLVDPSLSGESVVGERRDVALAILEALGKVGTVISEDQLRILAWYSWDEQVREIAQRSYEEIVAWYSRQQRDSVGMLLLPSDRPVEPQQLVRPAHEVATKEGDNLLLPSQSQDRQDERT